MGEGKNQSGWYEDENGTPFHVTGENMSDEMIKAMKHMATIAREAAANGDIPF